VYCPYFPELKFNECPGNAACEGTCDEIETARIENEIKNGGKKHEYSNRKK
jgi:hypothetical protein